MSNTKLFTIENAKCVHNFCKWHCFFFLAKLSIHPFCPPVLNAKMVLCLLNSLVVLPVTQSIFHFLFFMYAFPSNVILLADLPFLVNECRRGNIVFFIWCLVEVRKFRISSNVKWREYLRLHK